MKSGDDLAHTADLLGLQIPRGDLEQWALMLLPLFADLERLIDLPIEDREPDFVARLIWPPPAV